MKHLIAYVVITSFLCVYLRSYAPKKELQSYTTPIEDAPSGMLYRGHYTVASLFTDDDQNEHLKVSGYRIPRVFILIDSIADFIFSNVLQWEWAFEIKKDWH